MDENNVGGIEVSGVKVIKGASPNTTYTVVAEDGDIMVAVKPEVAMVHFDAARRFFQIGFRVHVRPQKGHNLPPKGEVMEKLNIGHLATREPNPEGKIEGGARYVGVLRIPACNITLSPWVVQEHIIQGQLVEKLVEGLFSRLNGSGLTLLISPENLIELAREKFLDMIPDNKTPLPEIKVYYGKESYYPEQTVATTPPGKPEEDDDSE